MRFLRALAPVLCVFVPLWAVETQVWEHSGQADFEKGALRKLSLSSDGRLSPAPVLHWRLPEGIRTTGLFVLSATKRLPAPSKATPSRLVAT